MTSAANQDVRAMRRQLPALPSVLRKRDPPSGTSRIRNDSVPHRHRGGQRTTRPELTAPGP